MSKPLALCAAQTLDQALEWLQQHPKSQILAGGTDLMVQWQQQIAPVPTLLDISKITALGRLHKTAAGDWQLGAMVSYGQLLAHEECIAAYPMLADAARHTGALAIQNRGTLAGNIANASPAADSPPALLCYAAEVLLRSCKGQRRVPLDEFYLGYRQTQLRAGELIEGIVLPARNPQLWQECYRKVGPREAQSIAKVNMAVALQLKQGRVENCRIAMGAVAPVTLRLRKTEKLLCGKVLDISLIEHACDTAMTEISPIDDLRSTAAYRRQTARAILKRALQNIGLEETNE